MKLTTTLGAAAAAFAAYVYLKRNRTETTSVALGRNEAADDSAASSTGMPGTGAESPNIAERMKAAGVQGTQAGGDLSQEQLFGSSSQLGSQEPLGTGLPDLTRGA